MITQITIKISEEWKLMTDQQKRKYFKMSQEDKERFEKETEQLNRLGYFVDSNGVKSTDIKPDLKMFSSCTVKPKRNLSALCFYVKLNETKLREEFPNLSFKELSEVRHKRWFKLSAEDRQPYIQMAEKDKVRKEQEREQLLTQGYFIDQNGVKSTELKFKFTRSQLKAKRELRLKEKLKEKE